MYGSKARNLIKLSCHGVNVPKTWVIRNNYPLSILKENNINLSDREEVYNFFENKFNRYQELFEEVDTFLKNNKLIKRYAVRSSQEFEDGKENSFSGLFYTELNIGNTANIVNSIIKCWKESFNVGVMEYSKKDKDFKPSPCSVIIQEFIMSDKSGVTFKTEDNIIVDSNFGLAKSIVDGNTGTDEWIINAKNNETISFFSNKETINIPIRARINPNQGEKINYKEYTDLKVEKFDNINNVIEVTLPEQLKQLKSLDKKELNILINECNRVSKILNIEYYDIEWTFEEGRLYILQCRPLTKLLNIQDRNNCKKHSDFSIGLVSGEATGKAIFVRDDKDISKFESRSILVTKRLAGNILLAANKAIGCMIESKSPLSHSAIIARELGIPVIGNIKLENVKDGEVYYINGSTGEYKIVNGSYKDIERSNKKSVEKIKNEDTVKYIKDMLYKFEQDIIK